MDSTVLLDKAGDIAVVTLNLPEKRNALTPAMRAALLETTQAVMADPALRVMVLTGAGGAFCAGGDINRMGGGDAADARRRLSGSHEIVRLIANGPKPVVSAVEGPAFGGGLGFAAASDVVVATPATKLCASFSRLGLIPDCGLLWSLPARVGPACARRLFLDCSVVGGEEALRIGLADELAPDGGALDAALRRARTLASMAPLAVGLVKAACAGPAMDLEAALAFEMEHQLRLFETDDHVERRRAFLERRPTAS